MMSYKVGDIVKLNASLDVPIDVEILGFVDDKIIVMNPDGETSFVTENDILAKTDIYNDLATNKKDAIDFVYNQLQGKVNLSLNIDQNKDADTIKFLNKYLKKAKEEKITKINEDFHKHHDDES